MKALIIRWEKRLIAGLLAMTMLSGMIPTALAAEEGTEGNGTGQSTQLMKGAERAGKSDADDAELILNSEENAAESIPETVSESIPETEPETVPTEGQEEESELTEASEELLLEESEESPLLFSSGVRNPLSVMALRAEEPEPTLTLRQAIAMSALFADGDDQKTLLSESESGITVRNGAGLILLSNVVPADYADKTVLLVLTESSGISEFDLTSAVSIPCVDVDCKAIPDENGNNTTADYQFLGLGHEDTCFSGTLRYDKDTPQNISANRPLFNNLSTDAVLPNLYFVPNEGNTRAILAEKVTAPAGTEGGGDTDWQVTLSKLGKANGSNASFPCLISEMDSNSKAVKLTLTNTVELGEGISSLKCTSTGLFCAVLTSGTLTVNQGQSTAPVVVNSSTFAGGLVGMMSNGTLQVGAGTILPAVTASAGSAGGYVGEMNGGTVNFGTTTTAEDDSTNTVSGGTVPAVTATNGAAGGVVGTLSGGTVNVIDGTISGVKAATSGAAGGVVGALSGSGTVTMSGGTVSSVEADSGNVGGVVGTLENGTVTVSGGKITKAQATSGNAGGAAGTMSGGTVTVSGGTIATVTSAKGDVGGYVGCMTAGEITLAGGTVSTVTTSSGNAGGILGKVEKAADAAEPIVSITGNDSAAPTIAPTITSSAAGSAGGFAGSSTDILPQISGTFIFTIRSKITASGGSAGGLVGQYTNTAETSLNMSRYTIDVDVNAGISGGIFGTAKNNNCLKIDGTATPGETPNRTEIKCKRSNGSPFGGVVGTYQSNSEKLLEATLAVNNLKLTLTNLGGTSGGVIGTLPATCYVEMGGLEIVKTSGNPEKFGGLVAQMGVENQAQPSFLYVNGDVTVTLGSELKGRDKGGLIGDLFQGVVRLSGTTTVSGTVTPGGDTGRVIGRNDDGFVYAENGWVFIAPDGNASNIGNGSEILRLNDETGRPIDATTHTVTVNAITQDSDGYYQLNSTEDFLAYAISFNYAKSHYGETYANEGVLEFKTTINTADNQYVKVNAHIDLSGTSFLGIGRDNGIRVTPSVKVLDPFKGVFDGGGNTITLGMGDEDNPLNMNKAGDNADNNHHGRLALFSYVSGETTIKDVTVNGSINAFIRDGTPSTKLLCLAGVTAYQVGAVIYENVTSNVNISISNASGTNSDMKGVAMGGIVAQCANDSTVTLKNCTLSGTINSNGLSAHCGLLGGSWLRTDVTFGGVTDGGVTVGGVTVKDATLNAGINFGGLVSRATGHWNATAANSIRFIKETKPNTISGTSTIDSTRGLLVGDGLGTDNNAALYLEVGTWETPGSAYYVESDAVTLNVGTEYFDELVGMTIRDVASNDNGIVSLQLPNGAKIDIDENKCNTYTTQLGETGKSLENKNTRYYYNLNVFSDESSVEKLVLWGARQFAAKNIREKNWLGSDNKINVDTDLDLTGYSYYPVRSMGTVTIGNKTVNGTTLKFAYNKLNDIEKDNKQPSNDQKQHYLMHCGLIYNTTNNVTVQNTTIAGTVGTVGTGSGALICGSISGDDTAANKKKTVNLTNITLAGLKVAGGNTPLLINSIPTAVRLQVNGLSTGESGDDKYSPGDIAASSLIGAVGKEGAKYLELEFSNIALDGRIGQKDTTTILNNGEKPVDYKTYGSIFSKATLLDSFRYASDSYGIYNFNSDDEKVTFGKEISNSEESGCRNPGEQYWYYDDGAVENDLFVWDGIGAAGPKNETAASTYFANGYLPYVGHSESDGYLEMDINKKPVGLTVGCGTYADPYRINNGRQLTYLAYYLSNPKATVVKNYQVCFNTTILTNLKNGSTDFTEAEVAHAYVENTVNDDDKICKWNGTSWDNGGPSQENALLYLRNAYYLITGDITLNKQDYRGIGTLEQPFSGVIIGQKSDGENSRYPTVSIKVNNSSVANFGGLIRYSNGSVVKNLALDYDGTRIGMVNAAVPGNGNNPFFGGVVGYCMGGDTIIDNVSVTNAEASVNYSGDKSHLIAAGGYVGLVGGAREANGIETTGGGVVFRNMGGKTSDFGRNASNAFYRNPFVGRVLDGYACSEGCTVENTDNNYTIAQLDTIEKGLAIDNDKHTVTVSTAQGLWLLSAIVNSGAANGDIDAYKTGKPRSASYDSVGTIPSENPAAAADEAHWGGISNTNCVSYLVKAYAPGAQNLCAGTAYSLSFTKDVNVSDYKNGFRGIGASYGYSANIRTDAVSTNWENNVWRRNLLVSGVSGVNHTVTLAMDQKLYCDEAQAVPANQTYSGRDWFHQGAGLFVDFMSTGLCTVSDLTITGTVQLSYYDGEGNPTWSYGTNREANKNTTADNSTCPDPCVGGFAARTIYSGAGSTIQFTNLSLEGLTVGGGKYTGGAIGCVEKLGHNRSVTFDGSLNLTGLKVSSKGYNVCYTGGLIGWYNGGGSLTLGAAGTPVTVDASGSRVSSQMELTEATCARMGLLAGNVSSGTVKVQKLTFNGVKVEGLRVANVGGLFGCCESGVTSVTINDCALADLTAVSKNGQTDGVENDHGIFGLGGIIGRDQAQATKLTNVTISGSSKIYAGFEGDTQPTVNIFSVGGMVGILDKKDNNNKNEATFENCKVTGTGENPILILNSSVRAISDLKEDVKKCNAGGLIGFDSQDTELKKCTLTYVNVMSCITVGGLIGHENTNGLKISDVVLQGCNVVIPKTNAAYRAGLITGFTWDEIIGYRILAKDTSVGYFFDWECNASTPTETILTGMKTMNTSNVGLNLQNGSNKGDFYTYSSAPTGEAAGYTKSKYIGTWLGDQGKYIEIKLVAVAVKNCNTPLGNYGTAMAEANRPGVKVVYADYPADQDDLVEKGSLKLDVLPKTNSTVMKGDTPITLTGNGAGFYEDSGKNKGYLSAIWEESGNPNRFNMTYRSHGLNLTTEQNAYGSTFNAEEVVRNQEGQAVTIPDFSVLVIPMNDFNNNNKAYVDTALWKCIAALTNAGSDGSAATIEAVKSMVTSVDVGMYQWQEGADGTGTFVKQAALDGLTCSGKTFSLSGQVDNNKNRFTLVDVLFENPLDTNNPYHLYLPVLVRKVLQVSAEVNMLTGSSYYPDDYSEKGGYITAGFSDPVTAFIKYGYNDRTLDEWKLALTAENGCNWYYEKVLDLCSSPVSRLPSGTRLTLVDAQTRKMYWYELKEGDNQKEFNLKLMKDSDGNVFVPQLVSSFLILDEGGNVTGTKDECYYLTIQLPEPSAEDESVVNMQLSCPIGTLPKSEGAPVGRLSSSVNHRYVIYKRIVQAISSETRKVNAANENDTEMDDEGSISVTLSAKLSFADPAVKREFSTYPPAALYHQFNVSMRKYLADVQEDYPVALDAKNILWQYTLSSPDNTSLHYSRGQCSPNGQSVLSVGYGGKELVTWMQQYGELTATAVITLEYGNDVGSIFPSRSSDEDGETGLYVSADSRLANEANQLSITTNKVTGKDPKRYYTMKPSTADMVFEAAGNANGSDHSKQLGINPLDPGPDTTTNPITAAGSYEFNPSTEMEWLKQGVQIRYTFKLRKKTDAGYVGVPAEKADQANTICDYLSLQNIQIDGVDVGEENIQKRKYDISVYAPFDVQSLKSSVVITVNPATGSGTSKLTDFDYANYKLEVTAVLMDGDKEIHSTQAFDYIVYTNAKIRSDLIKLTN